MTLQEQRIATKAMSLARPKHPTGGSTTTRKFMRHCAQAVPDTPMHMWFAIVPLGRLSTTLDPAATYAGEPARLRVAAFRPHRGDAHLDRLDPIEAHLFGQQFLATGSCTVLNASADRA
jgi:hypothetical protein